jgi:hypothetical protein
MVQVSAQTAQTSPTFVAPRTPDGQPDMQGMYNGGDSTSIEPGINMNPTGFYDRVWSQDRAQAPAAGAPPAGAQAGAVRRSRTDSPDGSIPWQPWAAAKKKELREGMIGDPRGAKSLDTIDPVGRCLPAGVPRSNYTYGYNGYQILQPPGYVIILSEWNHMYRIIPLDDRPHVSPKIRLWMGDSRGRWEGNTLVVDVSNSNGKTWMDMAGTFHTEALHVVERYSILDASTIGYEATIEDPNVFTKPWKLFATLNRAEAGYEMYEYACHEGNRLLDNVLLK